MSADSTVATQSLRAAAVPTKAAANARLMQSLYQVHWISAALSLAMLLLFALTGIVLNHASLFKTEPKVTRQEAQLPASLLVTLSGALSENSLPPGPFKEAMLNDSRSNESRANDSRPNESRAGEAKPNESRESARRMPIPAEARQWFNDQFGLGARMAEVRTQGSSLRLMIRHPGKDEALNINLQSGMATHEITDRGWLSYLTDLHKGKRAGDLWRWFIDIFAIGVLVFSITGLWILQRHAPRRRAVWPVVAAGLVLPVLVVLLFV